MKIKPVEQAFSEIAAFMKGIKWFEDEDFKNDVFNKKIYLTMEGLLPVLKKMERVSKERSSMDFTRGIKIDRHHFEIFDDITSSLYMYQFKEGMDLMTAICIETSNKLSEL